MSTQVYPPWVVEMLTRIDVAANGQDLSAVRECVGQLYWDWGEAYPTAASVPDQLSAANGLILSLYNLVEEGEDYPEVAPLSGSLAAIGSLVQAALAEPGRGEDEFTRSADRGDS